MEGCEESEAEKKSDPSLPLEVEISMLDARMLSVARRKRVHWEAYFLRALGHLPSPWEATCEVEVEEATEGLRCR